MCTHLGAETAGPIARVEIAAGGHADEGGASPSGVGVVAVDVDDQVGAAVGVPATDLATGAKRHCDAVRNALTTRPVEVRCRRLGAAGRPAGEPAERGGVGDCGIE